MEPAQGTRSQGLPGGKIKRARVSDVSRRAGVSTATVSRVLNDPDTVSEKTRARVLAAINELDFVKSAAAFSLKSQHSNNVLVVVTQVGNIYYSQMFEGLQHRAEASGYNIILAMPSPSMGEDTVINQLRTGKVDGVIILDGYEVSDADYEFLSKFYEDTPPIVGFCESEVGPPYPHVYVDNRSAARTITRHLIARGHRHIGHVPGPPNTPVRAERLAGFMDAMQEAGLKVAEEDIYSGGFHRDTGRRVGVELARHKDRLPTAIFCSNDEVAMGLICELWRHGLNVPKDLSVVGFDDVIVSDVYVPPLTTMSQPRNQIGASAMELLLDILRDPAGNAGRRVELKTALCDRESVGPPRRRR